MGVKVPSLMNTGYRCLKGRVQVVSACLGKYFKLTAAVHSSPRMPYLLVGSKTSLAFALLSRFAGQLLCFVSRRRHMWARGQDMRAAIPGRVVQFTRQLCGKGLSGAPCIRE